MKGALSGFVKRWVPVNKTYDVVLGHMIPQGLPVCKMKGPYERDT